MITFIVICFIIGWLLGTIVNTIEASTKKEVIKSTCPPHSWSYHNVYNEDGSLHHQHLVCAKCGPLHGARENE